MPERVVGVGADRAQRVLPRHHLPLRVATVQRLHATRIQHLGRVPVAVQDVGHHATYRLEVI